MKVLLASFSIFIAINLSAQNINLTIYETADYIKSKLEEASKGGMNNEYKIRITKIGLFELTTLAKAQYMPNYIQWVNLNDITTIKYEGYSDKSKKYNVAMYCNGSKNCILRMFSDGVYASPLKTWYFQFKDAESAQKAANALNYLKKKTEDPF